MDMETNLKIIERDCDFCCNLCKNKNACEIKAEECEYILSRGCDMCIRRHNYAGFIRNCEGLPEDY